MVAPLLNSWRSLIARFLKAGRRAARSASVGARRPLSSAESSLFALADSIARLTTRRLPAYLAALVSGLADSILRPGSMLSRAPHARPGLLRAVGAAGLLIGAGGLAFRTGQPGGAAVPAALMFLAWALARLAFMLLGRPHEVKRGLTVGAWTAGLLPLALASLPGFGTAAWLLSAVQTYRALRGAGIAKRGALRTVSVGFGSQVVVIAGVWLARGPVMVLVS